MNEKVEEDELASYNPAITAPVSLQLTRNATTNNNSNYIASRHFSRDDDEEAAISSSPRQHDSIPAAASQEDSNWNNEEECVLTKYDKGWRRIVRNFSPSWFSVTMGTGISAILLNIIPFHAQWLYHLSIVMFILNAVLYALAFITSLLRYTLYPEIWMVMIRDPVNSLFLGTVPLGFATLIEMWTLVCVPIWGEWATTFAWVLWMVDAIVAVAITLSLSFILMSQENQTSLSRITAAQLLPIAASIVAAGTGAEVAQVLPNANHALGTIITCYVMWGMATPLAMCVIVIYYQRLALHKLPPREVLVSCFLPLGPLGFGGYTIMYLGKAARHVLPATGTLDPMAGPVFYIMGFLTALVLWGFAVTWLMFALATIAKLQPIPFNMGWWGFTFPLGVFAASTIQIGNEMPSRVFKYLGTIFAVAVLLLWCVVAAGTAKGAWTGKLFHAPCLKNLKHANGRNAGPAKIVPPE